MLQYSLAAGPPKNPHTYNPYLHASLYRKLPVSVTERLFYVCFYQSLISLYLANVVSFSGVVTASSCLSLHPDLAYGYLRKTSFTSMISKTNISVVSYL
jgi:hypothetical protein